MELNELRNKMDETDAALVELFKKRMQLSGEIVAYKMEHDMPILQPGREREVLLHVSDLAGPEFSMYARVLYATLMDLSRAYQNQFTMRDSTFKQKILHAAENTPKLFPSEAFVACPGVEGSFTQQACDKLFSLANIMYFRNFEGVFQAVDRGLCKYGVLPIENSSNGSVNGVYTLMRNYKFHIVGGIRLHIHHNLLARPGVKFEDIREIISHEQAIGQCSEFLAAHPEIKVTVYDNTALAAKAVAESERRDVAAICSHECGELYGLALIREHVQNNENNYTRFICISRDLEIYPGANHISLMCATPHKPGSLYRLISKFAALGVNLTKLESKPIPGRDFEFMFYLDLEASVWNEDVMNLLAELSSQDEGFVFLGCYNEI